MAKRPVLSDITSLTNSSNINVINQNWDAIQEAFDNTVSRDGSTPNTLSGDLDLNGNALLNVGTIDVNSLTLEGQQVTDLASVPEWRSAWLTGTSYIKNDLVKTNGNVYICLVSHTSGTFSTDLTALKWELMVSKGDSGGGTGDLLAANNLSDVANPATARANLGLGTAATENTVPVAKGGTGATDAVTARTNLGLGTVAVESTVPLSKGGTGQALTDPAGQRVLGWDDTNNQMAWFNAGTGISLSGNNISVSSSGGEVSPVSASGTSVSFSSIPSAAKKITIFFNTLSLSGSDSATVQLGTGGAAETTGYSSIGGRIDNTTTGTSSITSGFYLQLANNANALSGFMVIEKEPGSNTWHCTSVSANVSSGIAITAGRKGLSGVLDYFRVIPTGANTFDGGTISYRWS